MDKGAAGMGGIKIDKLTETNFHEWRPRIKMVLALRDLDNMLDEDGKPTDADSRELTVWKRRDTKASAMIGLTLGSEQLEHVASCLRKNLKAMGGEVTEMDIAMSVLNGLTSKYENLLVALDAKGEDQLSLEFVKSRLLQEELRQADKSLATKRIGDMALVGANYRGQGRRGDLSKIECYYCLK